MTTIVDKMIPKFPAQALGGDGITITQTGGVYTFSITPGFIPALDADLTAIAGLTSAANKGIQFTGSGTAGTYDLTAYAKTILDDADASSVLSTLGVSTFAKTILDDANAGTARTTLGAAASGGNTDITSLTGTTTNDSAAAGKIGEYLSSSVAVGSAVTLTTATAKDITTLALTAGDWDVSINSVFSFNAVGTLTYVRSSLSGTVDTLDTTAGRFAQLSFASAGITPAGNFSVALPSYRISVAVTTTFHLVSDAGFGSGTTTGWGIIRARRLR